MKKIVLTGGGTAGHITPNIALIGKLREDFELHYIGGIASMEEKLIKGEDIPFYPVKVGKLRRYFDLKNLSDPFRVIAGICQSAKLIRKLKPDVVFAKGGFVSVPVVVGAWLNRVPAVLHESDRTPGLANRLCIPMCSRICTAFPETAEKLGKKAVETGLPIRPALLKGSKEKGLSLAGLSDKKPVIIVMGGSQGAGAINSAVRSSLPELLKKYSVIHLCGKGNLDGTLDGTDGYFQTEYADETLPDLLAASDIAVSRAGAGALFEFAALRIPTIAIPLPLNASRGDQIENARDFQSRGFVKTLPQEELTEERLISDIEEMFRELDAYHSALEKADMAGATERVAEVILSAMK